MASLLVKALIQRRKVSENKDESEELDVPTTRVAYVKVTPTISNWIQPIAIETTSRCGSDGSRDDRDPVASVDRPLDRIPGVYTIAYDILINGVRSNVDDATADHDRKLYRLVQRYRSKRIYINADKLKFKQSKVAYFGQLLTNDGFQTHPRELTRY